MAKVYAIIIHSEMSEANQKFLQDFEKIYELNLMSKSLFCLTIRSSCQKGDQVTN